MQCFPRRKIIPHGGKLFPTVEKYIPKSTQIKNRLKRFEKEMEFIDRFNISFVNDDLKEAIVEVEKAIKEKI